MRLPFHQPLRSNRRGTSLVELLVVIVVFLIGILAVAQIFPGGFKILAGTRSRSLASTLALAQSERLKSRPDLLPEAILPVRVENAGAAQVIVYEEKSPTDYAPTADAIDANGNALAGGAALGKWGQLSGPNTFRRVVGETHRIGAPRFLSPYANTTSLFGGLVTLEFGPVDLKPNAPTLSVYGRDLFRKTGDVPLNATDAPRPYEYILVDANLPTARVVIPAPVPTGANPMPAQYDYSVFLAAYLNDGGNVIRREFELPSGVLNATDASDPADVGYTVRAISSLLVTGSATFLGVERDSVRIARSFRRVAAANPFSDDPYEYRVVNPFLGTLLFNPVGYNLFEQRPGESRQPFAARVNYDVYDWRVLHEEFRIPRGKFDIGATPMPPSVRLAVSPLRSTNDTGADGLRTIPFEQSVPVNALSAFPNNWSTPAQDHFVLLDLETGGIYYETYQGKTLLDVNKSTGRVRFLPYDATGEPRGWLLLPDGSSAAVATANRAVRAYYVGKDEWAVQVTRAPARYTRFVPVSGTPRPISGTYALGPDLSVDARANTRIYFPPSDRGRKVTIGRISYLVGTDRKTYEGGDFVLGYGQNDPLGTLPYLDIKEVDGAATAFDASVSEPASAVRGASVVVRVFHNETKFPLNTGGTIDLTQPGNAFDRYLRQWRVDTKETFLDSGEPRQ